MVRFHDTTIYMVYDTGTSTYLVIYESKITLYTLFYKHQSSFSENGSRTLNYEWQDGNSSAPPLNPPFQNVIFGKNSVFNT